MRDLLLGGVIALSGAATGFIFGAGVDWSKPTNIWEIFGALGTVGATSLAACAALMSVRRAARDRRDAGILALVNLYEPIVTMQTTLTVIEVARSTGSSEALGQSLTNQIFLHSITAIYQAPRGVIEKYDRRAAVALRAFQAKLLFLKDDTIRQLFGTPEMEKWLKALSASLLQMTQHVERANKKARELGFDDTSI